MGLLDQLPAGGEEPGTLHLPPTSRAPDHHANLALRPPLRIPMHPKYKPWATPVRQIVIRRQKYYVGRLLRPENLEIYPNKANTWPQRAGPGPQPPPHPTPAAPPQVFECILGTTSAIYLNVSSVSRIQNHYF